MTQHFSTHHFGGVWNHLRCSNWRCCYHKGVPEKFGDGGCRFLIFLKVSMSCCFKVLFHVGEGCVLGCIGHTRRQVCWWNQKGSQWHSAVKNGCQILWGHLVLRLSWPVDLFSSQICSPRLTPRRFRDQLLHFFTGILVQTFGVGERKHSWHREDRNGGLPSDKSFFAIFLQIPNPQYSIRIWMSG